MIFEVLDETTGRVLAELDDSDSCRGIRTVEKGKE